jgi:uncharacterized protein (TIGR01777 family)
MMAPFRFFVGGPIGSGRQYLSWIHRLDWIEMIRWIIDTPSTSGAVNATAPVPVTNREFARALGRAMHRPSLMPAPAFALRLFLGEMADPLALTSLRVIPQCALSHKFHFRYPGDRSGLSWHFWRMKTGEAGVSIFFLWDGDEERRS